MIKVEPVPWRGVRLAEKIVLILLPLLAVAVLALPFLDQVILRRLARLPGMRPVISWLVNGVNMWLLGAAVILLFVLVIVLVRRRLVNNKQLWFGTGCPQCMERELVRVSRRTSDRYYGLIGVPAYRYACRNCTWRGLRIARREHSPLHEMELEASLMRFDPHGQPPNWPVAASSVDTPDAEIALVAADSSYRDEGVESAPEDLPQSGSGADIEPTASEIETSNHADSEPVDGMEWLWRRSSE